MTEDKWLVCADPTPMLDFLQGKVSDRKFLLFGSGCCRRIWPLMTDIRSRRAVEWTEQLIEGLVDDSERSSEWVLMARGAVAAFGNEIVDYPQRLVWYPMYLAKAAITGRAGRQGEAAAISMLRRDVHEVARCASEAVADSSPTFSWWKME